MPKKVKSKRLKRNPEPRVWMLIEPFSSPGITKIAGEPISFQIDRGDLRDIKQRKEIFESQGIQTFIIRSKNDARAIIEVLKSKIILS